MRKYFGRGFPVRNILVSKLIFLTIDYRKKRLIRYNSKNSYQKKDKVVLQNSDNVKEEILRFIHEGYTKLNIGGGVKNLEGYINIDFVKHPVVQREVVANILDLGFIPDNSFSHIHSNHVIEHLTESQFDYQLQEYRRILKKGGIITIRCPNILGVSYGFFHGAIPETGREEFINLGYPKDEDFYNPLDNWYHKDLYGYFHWVYGDIGNLENQHLNKFTSTKLKKQIEKNGFDVLKMGEPETSNIILIAKVK